MKLTRYWFEFEISDRDLRRYTTYSGLKRGCGVTAHSYEDALNVLRAEIFREDPIPQISRVIENVDVSTLDEGHVLPNIGVPTWRGVWFPRFSLTGSGRLPILKH